ncbi:hypothetical protein BDQ17DRAFT_459050 [Cyathus striatus]|nr:hypothetical protein BDQ17DRAFT_459050 [Cyathus striatus]
MRFHGSIFMSPILAVTIYLCMHWTQHAVSASHLPCAYHSFVAHDFYINQLFAVDGRGGTQLHHLADSACLGAGHQSKERFDVPKCHPETRIAILEDIMSWVNSKNPKEHMMWLSGPAGAGKSSIAQTVCEQCHFEQKLLSSFFFSRTAAGTGRDDGNRLVPTIACQLAIAIPEARDHIVDQLEKDPTLLTYSMEVQMQKLVLDPLAQVYEQLRNPTNSQNPDSTATQRVAHVVGFRLPNLVVIDGLDECHDPQMQSNIVTMIATIRSRQPALLRFLIASRPELEIRNTFNAPTVSEMYVPIVLNEHYKSDEDIETYLRRISRRWLIDHLVNLYTHPLL